MVALNRGVGSALLSIFILSIALVSGGREETVLTCKDDPSLFLAATIKKETNDKGSEVSRKLMLPRSLFVDDIDFEGSRILQAHDESQWELTRNLEFQAFPLFTLKLIDNGGNRQYQAGQELAVPRANLPTEEEANALKRLLYKCDLKNAVKARVIDDMPLDYLTKYAFETYAGKDTDINIGAKELGEEVRAATLDPYSVEVTDKSARTDLAHRNSDAVKSIYEILINKKLQYNEKGAAWVGAAAKLEADSMGSFMISPFASLDIANDINFIPYKLRVISASFGKASINPLGDPHYEGPQYLRPLQTKNYNILPSLHVTGDTPPLWRGTYLNEGGTYTCSAKIDLEGYGKVSKEWKGGFNPDQNPGLKFLNQANMNIKVLDNHKQLHEIGFVIHVAVEKGVPWTVALALDTLSRDDRAAPVVYKGKQTFYPATCEKTRRQLGRSTTVDFPQIPPVISPERVAVFLTHVGGVTTSFGLGEPFILPVYTDRGAHPPGYNYGQPESSPKLVPMQGSDSYILAPGGENPAPEVVGVRVIGILTDETMAKPKVKSSRYPVKLHRSDVAQQGKESLGFTHYFTQPLVLTHGSEKKVRFSIWVSSDTTSALSLWFYVDSPVNQATPVKGPDRQAETFNLFRQHLGDKKCVDSVSYSRASNIYSPDTPLFKRTRLEISETPLHFPSTLGDFIIFDEPTDIVKADKSSYADLELLKTNSEEGLFSMMLKWLRKTAPFEDVDEALVTNDRERFTAMMKKAETDKEGDPPFVYVLYSPAFVRALCVEYALGADIATSPDVANRVEEIANKAIECQARLHVYQMLRNYDSKRPRYAVEIPLFLQFLRRDDKMSIFEAHSRHGAPRLPVKLVVEPPARIEPPAGPNTPAQGPPAKVVSPLQAPGDQLLPFTESKDLVVEDVPTATMTLPSLPSPTQGLESGAQVNVPIRRHESAEPGSSEQPSSGVIISRPPQFNQFNHFDQNNRWKQFNNFDFSSTNYFSTTNNYFNMPLIVIIIDNNNNPPTAVAKITTDRAAQTCPAQNNDQSTQCGAVTSGTGSGPSFGSVEIGTEAGPTTSSIGVGTEQPTSRSITSQTSLIDIAQEGIKATIMVPSTAQNIERVLKGRLQHAEFIKPPDFSRPCAPPFGNYGNAFKPKGHRGAGSYAIIDNPEWSNRPPTTSSYRNKDSYTRQ